MSAAVDAAHMRRAIALARGVLGSAWPNPAVGCVIAERGRVIAEAATRPGGRPHAEEQALAAAGDAARGAVAYVTLEPCAERTNGSASCAQRLIASGVARVVFACENPHGLTAGGGVARLRSAGVEVESGRLAEEAAPLYRGFLHHVRSGLPLVEAAAAPDGYDGLFEPAEDEPLAQALQRFGAAGYRLLWTPSGGPVAAALNAEGRLAH